MNPTSEEDESGTTEQNEDSENVDIKQKIEAYGIGVRGGTITPQEDDEKYFRESLELPNPNLLYRKLGNRMEEQEGQ